MVGSINAPTTGNKTLAAFEALAKVANTSSTPPKVAGGILKTASNSTSGNASSSTAAAGTSSSSTRGSTTPTSTFTPASGAANMAVNVGMAGAVLVVALAML
jgi:hypothetical protein